MEATTATAKAEQKHSNFGSIILRVTLNANGMPTIMVDQGCYSQQTAYYPCRDEVAFESPGRLTEDEREYVLNAYRGLRIIVKRVQVQAAPKAAWAIEAAWYGDHKMVMGDIDADPRYSIRVEAHDVIRAMDKKHIVRKQGVRPFYFEPQWRNVKCKIEAWGYYGARA